jgi:hypothetical protein
MSKENWQFNKNHILILMVNVFGIYETMMLTLYRTRLDMKGIIIILSGLAPFIWIYYIAGFSWFQRKHVAFRALLIVFIAVVYVFAPLGVLAYTLTYR